MGCQQVGKTCMVLVCGSLHSAEEVMILEMCRARPLHSLVQPQGGLLLFSTCQTFKEVIIYMRNLEDLELLKAESRMIVTRGWA